MRFANRKYGERCIVGPRTVAITLSFIEPSRRGEVLAVFGKRTRLGSGPLDSQERHRRGSDDHHPAEQGEVDFLEQGPGCHGGLSLRPGAGPRKSEPGPPPLIPSEHEGN